MSQFGDEISITHAGGDICAPANVLKPLRVWSAQLLEMTLQGSSHSNPPAPNESPGARWKALFLNMAPALSNCQWLDCISSGSINQKPTFREIEPWPAFKRYLLPSAPCCNPGEGQVEQVGPDLAGGRGGVNTDFGR